MEPTDPNRGKARISLTELQRSAKDADSRRLTLWNALLPSAGMLNVGAERCVSDDGRRNLEGQFGPH